MSDFEKDRRVLAVHAHGPHIAELCIERRGLVFEPGDCMAIYAEHGDESRPYSLASGTEDPELRFLIRKMAGGVVSPFLCSRKPGDVVRVTPPFGWFRPGARAAQRPFVFLATGTGIAPFIAYLRSPGAIKPAMFWYGCRTAADLVHRDWLREAGGAQFSVSRELEAGLHHGRITHRLDELPVGDLDYYLCGLDSMLDEVTRYLRAKNVALAHIHRECFFNAPLES